ncbi:ABC transporter ATP-binding protein [Pseudonocardia sp. GCM10023141]|uniref:ABC transporter ATP-binding protein n=1 Tax=Pseudonocardia sp. GCM10023141 TaxID=3252653 RepID=UPI00361EFB1C
MSGLALVDLAVGYRQSRRSERAVLDGLVARARRGELTALVGPNGSGKSTLLRTLAGLQPALAGAVRLDGADLLAMPPPERALRLAVVLTERVDAGLLTARELVAIGRHPHTGPSGALRRADLDAVDAALLAVDAEHLAARRVAELSDGERQRVLTARALAQQPSVLLLDEPSAFLDVSSRVALLGLLRTLAREQDLCVVVSTHDLELVLRLADHVWLVDRTGGLRTGPPEQLVTDGAIAAVFDTDGLAFDPASGTFALRAAGAVTVLVRAPQPVAELVGRALARHGWRPVGAGPADAEIEQTGDGFRVHHRGGSTTLAGWAELADWGRSNGGGERPDPLQESHFPATTLRESGFPEPRPQ